MAKQKKMILGPNIIKNAVKLHIRRIKESQEALEYFQKICIHDYEYDEYFDGSDWERCKFCGFCQRLPAELLGIGYENKKSDKDVAGN